MAVLLATSKACEEAAKERRIAIEEQIASLIPCGERSSKTVKLDDGTKLTVKRGLSYKYDIKKLTQVANELGYTAPIKLKSSHELDVKAYEWLRENDSNAFISISKQVSVTPLKTGVTIKPPK